MLETNLKKYLINESETIRVAMLGITDVSGIGLVVVDDHMMLKGTITDGDIRRSFLKGISIDDQVHMIMKLQPTVFKEGTEEKTLFDTAKKLMINFIPIIDDRSIIKDVYIHREIKKIDVPVVLMAGGLGTRLGSITKDCPKPMLKIGNKPILHRIVENLSDNGFSNYYLSVNYHAEIIENYFKTGENFNCRIKYLKEKERLGTAGSLSMLPKDIDGPVLVMNGDLLTDINFRKLAEAHIKYRNEATICVKEYSLNVPYGVLGKTDNYVNSFDEKPTHKFHVNAGVYIFNSELFNNIPSCKFFDMTSFINILIKKGVKIRMFPVIESWIDIGQKHDLELARDRHTETNKI